MTAERKICNGCYFKEGAFLLFQFGNCICCSCRLLLLFGCVFLQLLYCVQLGKFKLCIRQYAFDYSVYNSDYNNEIFADEKYQKTDQALFTAPVSLTRVVLGKFLGAFVLYAICSAIFLLYAVVISFFATPEWSVILCTFIGLLLFGAALLAINIFISSLTESTIVAAIVSMAVNLVIYMMTNFTSMISIDWIKNIVEKIDFATYYNSFKYGLLSAPDIVFFLSVAGLFVFLLFVFWKKTLELRR